MSKKVFVTQIPHRLDGQTLIPAINIGPASEFGEIEIMFPPRANFFATNILVKQLEEKLNDYNFDNGDSLLPLGDPVLLAAACAILGKRGDFRVLRWDKNIKRYTQSTIIL